jgi:hypothetical protein
LEYLDVSENVMTSDSLKTLSNELQSNATLQRVKAKNVQASDDDVHTILQGFKDHPTLNTLDASKLEDEDLDHVLYL